MTAANALEVPKASVFCEDPAKPSKVGVMGGGTRRVFEIASGALVIGAEDPMCEPLREWIRRHRSELEACSAEAVEIYYRYYPERRPIPSAAADVR